jgi:hypothetical protein
LAREEAAFFGDVRDAIIPMIFPAPQVQIGQASTWTRNLAMFHEPSASAVMPMAVGSAPQKSLSIDSLLRRIKISATGRAEHIIRVVFPTLINIRSAAAGITERPAADPACFGGVFVAAVALWTAGGTKIRLFILGTSPITLSQHSSCDVNVYSPIPIWDWNLFLIIHESSFAILFFKQPSFKW